MKRISLTLGVVAAAGLFLVGSVISPAAAVTMSHHSTVTSLVYYAENRGVTRVDSDADGALEHGDMVERELALSRTLGGKVIGGTGKYAGARGSGTMTLLENDRTFKVVLKLMM